MAKKFEFDSSISMSMQSAASDSFVDNIKMIDISEIKPSIENFYDISNIEVLADDIEREGLKHNLVVTKDIDGSGYWLKSGHRRLAALKLLMDSNRLKATKIPCYVDGEKSAAETKLDLIMLNATQRKYTDAETMQEYEELEKTFRELADSGKPLKGRMRENIAAALQVSSAQVGKIDNIKHNAIPDVEQAVKAGDMSISTANEVAKLAPEKQQEIMEKSPDISHKEVKSLREKEKKEKREKTDSTPDVLPKSTPLPLPDNNTDVNDDIDVIDINCATYNTDDCDTYSTNEKSCNISFSVSEAREIYNFIDCDDYRSNAAVTEFMNKLKTFLD